MLIAALRVAAPRVPFFAAENRIHMHWRFIQDSHHVDCGRMPNRAIVDLKIAMATWVDSREDRRTNPGGKTEAGNRGNAMRAGQFCREVRPDKEKRAAVDRSGMLINRMETVRRPAGKSCAATVAMPVPIRESCEMPREK
ncbi:hypothetical protein [Burkholderia cepacia]|uniref:hypothetical protein n=1 Tax=Burkholderia cepacia TaxID=292 RepID=UPI000AD4DB59|nr:hypothetical protein [Burkholderia cepacia]MCA7935054.1 hypothetical protein [Burkholderia cepacia]MCA8464933.1 hypothetical protein [Burkholderia cepacia]MDN7761753.1 hypothetical protein [Burkholderia cepacia]QCY06276.1 hypothetical protein EJ998_24970 [Burkholderia cepacia ATCC 25416]